MLCRTYVHAMPDICACYAGHMCMLCRTYVHAMPDICACYAGHMCMLCRTYVHAMPDIVRCPVLILGPDTSGQIWANLTSIYYVGQIGAQMF